MDGNQWPHSDHHARWPRGKRSGCLYDRKLLAGSQGRVDRPFPARARGRCHGHGSCCQWRRDHGEVPNCLGECRGQHRVLGRGSVGGRQPECHHRAGHDFAAAGIQRWRRGQLPRAQVFASQAAQSGSILQHPHADLHRMSLRHARQRVRRLRRQLAMELGHRGCNKHQHRAGAFQSGRGRAGGAQQTLGRARGLLGCVLAAGKPHDGDHVGATERHAAMVDG